ECLTQAEHRLLEYAHVGAHRHKVESPIQVSSGVVLDRRQNASGFTMRLRTLMQVAYDPLDVGVVGVAQMPQGSGEIRRANEDAVHTVHRDDIVEGFDTRPAFDLH